MSVRRAATTSPTGAPLDNTPDWRRQRRSRAASQTGQPVIPEELFDRPRKQGDYVRAIKLNEPFLIANGVDTETIRSLTSIDLEEMYKNLMTGGGYFRLRLVHGGWAHERSAALCTSTSERTSCTRVGMAAPCHDRFNMTQLWWEWMYADELMSIYDESVATGRPPVAYFPMAMLSTLFRRCASSTPYLRKSVGYARLRAARQFGLCADGREHVRRPHPGRLLLSRRHGPGGDRSDPTSHARASVPHQRPRPRPAKSS